MPTSSKTIAKNTLFLYFRMILVMLVSLYTSRVVLDVLGASDYGLYNVVGGIVAMMAVLNGSISAGTSRFITYELGVGNKERLRDVFNISLVCHVTIALIVFVLAETIGLWFVNSQIVFDANRTLAVNVVYQLSILTIMLQFTQMPYTADIIAHEQMSIYAYISILEVGLKLLMVYALIKLQNVDALIAYAIMVFFIQVLIILLYKLYCYIKYEESHWRFVKEIKQYKAIFSFAGWDIIGNLSVITQGQGINILLNIYFGPIVNAARAVAYQVQGAVMQFTSSFMTAVKPEIVKSYARKEYNVMIQLINDASLYSFYLLSVFVIPLLFKIDYVLDLWLKEVPQYAGIFTVIILVNMLFRTVASPVIHGTHATGDIKSLNLYAGGLGLLPLPVCWIGFHLGMPSVFSFWIILIWGVFANIAEIVIFKMKMPEFSVKQHLKVVYLRCILVSCLMIAPCYFLGKHYGETIWGYVLYYTTALVICAIIIFVFGLTKSLRNRVIIIVKNATKRIMQRC